MFGGTSKSSCGSIRPPSFIFSTIRIQIGSATLAPSAPLPIVWVFWSFPTQTPIV